jgi:hypothetical protein
MSWCRSQVVTSVAVLLVAFCALLGMPSPGRTAGPELTPELEKLRSALEKYQDPYMAVRDGYFSTLGCVNYPKPGGPGQVPYAAGSMGIHFLNPQVIGPVPDPMRPAILLYEPVDGKLRLVGAEWFVPLATGVKERPTLYGQPFQGPMAGHEPLMPAGLRHYDLHVWLWKANPAGLFAPTNPDVRCDGYPHTLDEEAPQLGSH